MVGKTLGHYEILEPLGKGGMGEVCRAGDTTRKREVALSTGATEDVLVKERRPRGESVQEGAIRGRQHRNPG